MIFSTSCTIEAIYFAESLFMQIGQRTQHFISVAFLQQTLVRFLMFFGEQFPIFRYHYMQFMPPEKV
jgi:hypothetical protein